MVGGNWSQNANVEIKVNFGEKSIKYRNYYSPFVHPVAPQSGKRRCVSVCVCLILFFFFFVLTSLFFLSSNPISAKEEEKEEEGPSSSFSQGRLRVCLDTKSLLRRKGGAREGTPTKDCLLLKSTETQMLFVLQ